MEFIGRSKIQTALLVLVTCLLWLGLRAAVCPATTDAAEEKATATDPNSPAVTQNDPNTPAEKIADPNTPDDDEDVFSPKISTLIKINRGFESIFSPDFVTEDGLVHYAELRRKRSDLLTVIRELNNLNPIIYMSLSPKEKTAFWINTHNACLLDLIIENYPIESKWYMVTYPNNSIMQITGDWRSKHFFKIQGFQYKLQEIEQELLGGQDPRVLFALHYASMGGGLLRSEPYTAEKLDEQLDDQVKRYLATQYGIELDKNKHTLSLSNLFTMYGHKEFFESTEFAKIKRYRDRDKLAEQAWLNFIHDYLAPEDLQYLQNSDFDIKFIKYDWELNEAP